MGWIGWVRCKKFWCDFVAQTFALIAPVQPILHRVSCSNERLPNAPKHYETHKNMSLGSNGVDRVDSLHKIPMRIRGTNFWIKCSSLAHFALSFMQLWNNPKCPKHYKTHQYMHLGSNGVDRVCSLWKILMRLHGTNLCINCTISTRVASDFVY